MTQRVYILFLILVSIGFADIISPSLSENLRTVHVLFEWDQEPNAEGYNLQVSESQSFNNPIINIELPTTSHIVKENLVWEQNYFWRVRALYSNDQGPWMLGNFEIQSKLLIDVNVDAYDENSLVK